MAAGDVVDFEIPEAYVVETGAEPIPLDISWYFYVAGHVLQNADAVDWQSVIWHLPSFTTDEAAGRSLPAWREQFDKGTSG